METKLEDKAIMIHQRELGLPPPNPEITDDSSVNTLQKSIADKLRKLFDFLRPFPKTKPGEYKLDETHNQSTEEVNPSPAISKEPSWLRILKNSLLRKVEALIHSPEIENSHPSPYQLLSKKLSEYFSCPQAEIEQFLENIMTTRDQKHPPLYLEKTSGALIGNSSFKNTTIHFYINVLPYHTEKARSSCPPKATKIIYPPQQFKNLFQTSDGIMQIKLTVTPTKSSQPKIILDWSHAPYTL